MYRRKIYRFDTFDKATEMVKALNEAQQAANTFINTTITYKNGVYIVTME